MIYQDYMRRKMHNVVKLGTAEGYPLTVYSCANTNLKDYTIYGNTGGVGDKTENLFNISKSDGFTSQYIGLTNTITDNVITVSSTTNRIGYLTLGTFEAGTYYIGMTSEDYTGLQRITVNNVDSNISVNNLITISERSVIKIMINVGAGTTWHFTNIQITKSNVATSFEPYDKYKIPITVTGKNLIPYPYSQTTQTTNGITFTDNGDGSVTANGTAKSDVSYAAFIFTSIDDTFLIQGGTYTMSGISGGSATTFYIQLKNTDTDKTLALITNRAYTFKLDEPCRVRGNLIIKGGTTVSNLVFKPQLELGTSATSYEPYHEPVTTNIFRDAQLGQGESINYKSDSLPDITLKKGTNIITADTEVKPSNIKIKYLKK